MTPLQVTIDLDQAPWIDLQSANPTVGTLERIGVLRHGTTEGNAAVALVVVMPDGSRALAQTTWKLLRFAYTALAASPVIAEEVIDP